MAEDRGVNPMDLSLEQLSSLRAQNEEELVELSRQMEALHGARGRYGSARGALDQLQAAPEDGRLLVPLNSSLYVPGRTLQPSKVIVELGTGYYCEKSAPEARELIDRKVALLNKSIETIESVGNTKRRNLDQLAMVMNYKIQQAQQRA